MDLKFKQYKFFKTKNDIKQNNLLFFFKEKETNHKKWIKIFQKQKILFFTIFRIFNKIIKNFIKHSIFKFFIQIINTVTILFWFFKFKKIVVLNYLESVFWLDLFVVKINNRIYSGVQLKKNFSINYTNCKLLLFKIANTIFKNSQ